MGATNMKKILLFLLLLVLALSSVAAQDYVVIESDGSSNVVLTESEWAALATLTIANDHGATDVDQVVTIFTNDFDLEGTFRDTSAVEISPDGAILQHRIEFEEGLTSDFNSDYELVDIKYESLPLMGKHFFISEMILNPVAEYLDMTLVSSSVMDTLEEGQIKYYTIDGVDYEVLLRIVDPVTREVQFKVNGEISDTLKKGETDRLSDGSLLGVREILISDVALVEFFLGAQIYEIEIENFNSGFNQNEENENQFVKVIYTNDSSTITIDEIIFEYRNMDNIFTSETLFIPVFETVMENTRFNPFFMVPTIDLRLMDLSDSYVKFILGKYYFYPLIMDDLEATVDDLEYYDLNFETLEVYQNSSVEFLVDFENDADVAIENITVLVQLDIDGTQEGIELTNFVGTVVSDDYAEVNLVIDLSQIKTIPGITSGLVYIEGYINGFEVSNARLFDIEIIEVEDSATVQDPFLGDNQDNSTQNETSDDSPIGLKFKDILVEVDGDKDSSADEKGGQIDKDVKPGSIIDFEIEIENLLDDIDIEDVEVTIDIFGIDDGDDLDESEDINKIKDGDKETVNLRFEVPLELDDDQFDVTITAQGEGEDGKTYKISLDMIIEIDKDKDDIRFKDVDLLSYGLSCSRETSVEIEIINVGEDDRDDVKVKVSSSALGISESKTGIDLEADADDDNKWDGRISFEISKTQKAGTYPISIEVFAEDGARSDSKVIDLEVRDCASASSSSNTGSSQQVSNQESSTTNEVIVQYEGQTQTDNSVSAGVYAKSSSTTTSSLDDEGVYVLMLAILVLISFGGVGLAILALRP